VKYYYTLFTLVTGTSLHVLLWQCSLLVEHYSCCVWCKNGRIWRTSWGRLVRWPMPMHTRTARTKGRC